MKTDNEKTFKRTLQTALDAVTSYKEDLLILKICKVNAVWEKMTQ